jgi:glycerol-3-phosphate dehydrogenase (NAD(P)+)
MAPTIPRDAPITVLGAGSYGTALGIQLARSGHPTALWARNRDHIERLAAERVNQRYLPGCPFPAQLQPQPDLATALSVARHVLVAVPSHAVRELLEQVKPLLRADARLACAAKGLEPESGKLPHRCSPRHSAPQARRSRSSPDRLLRRRWDVACRPP